MPLSLRDRLLKIDTQCSDAHGLLNQIATRDSSTYPLPAHIEANLRRAIAGLTDARDALHDLAGGDSNN
jgi:hypothetical protein